MKPSSLARNFTPTSIAELSEALGLAGLTPLCQMVHGQAPGGGPELVVNDQFTEVIVLPAASCASLTATVYAVDGASAADGVNVSVRLAASYALIPGTLPP